MIPRAASTCPSSLNGLMTAKRRRHKAQCVLSENGWCTVLLGIRNKGKTCGRPVSTCSNQRSISSSFAHSSWISFHSTPRIHISILQWIITCPRDPTLWFKTSASRDASSGKAYVSHQLKPTNVLQCTVRPPLRQSTRMCFAWGSTHAGWLAILMLGKTRHQGYMGHVCDQLEQLFRTQKFTA